MPSRAKVPLVTRHLADALLGIALTAALFGALEAALWIAGVEPDPPLELSRGFDPSYDYIVPDPEVDGGWRVRIGTAIDQQPIPPRSGALRVLIFGGSNARGFKVRSLRGPLARLAGARDVEVFNLGRSGYGSGRVKILFEQALERLDPDVAVLYSGHNEFVEEGFRREVEHAWSSAWDRRVAEWAQRFRAARWLRDRIESAHPERHAQRSEWKRDDERFKSIHYERTLQLLDAYRDNLRQMVAIAREAGVHLALGTVVYNRFSPPYWSPLLLDLDAPTRERFQTLLRGAEGRLPDAFGPVAPHGSRARIQTYDWTLGKRDGAGSRGAGEVPVGLRESTGPLAGRDPKFPAGKRSDKHAEFFTALAQLHAGPRDESERADIEASAADLDAALAIVPDHARALYLRGLVAWSLGQRDAEVRHWFESAARLDLAPQKASAAVNERIRSVAAESPEVQLVECDELFASGSELGLVGWEWMIDHCHLAPGAREIVLEAFAQAIAERWPIDG